MKKILYKVYIHKFPNKKIYVGITKRSLYDRWQNGLGYRRQKRIYNAIQKYGWDNIEHKMVYDNLTFEEACIKEQELIKKYKTYDKKYGYNCSIGGEKGALGYKHTEEAKQKIKEHNAKYWLGKTRAKETIEKMREASKGNTNRRGAKQTEIANQKNREKHSIPVLQIKGDEIIKRFNSAKEAEQELNLHKGSVSKVCKGKRKTTGGYEWRYANNQVS